MGRLIATVLAALALWHGVPASAWASQLDQAVGRTEVRVRSEAYPLLPGRTVAEYALPERLERLGYVRVHARPTAPGEYFWGTDVFWVYRRAHRYAGVDHPDRQFGLVLDAGGSIVDGIENDAPLALNGKRGRWLEPETLAESTDDQRTPREHVTFAALPEHVWRPVLALEDHRFFDHIGVDGKAIARAAWQNATSGHVEQGASTLTMQLVKNRDLTPKRTMDRKASEALRALALEAEHTKEEILEAYLNTVYYGHVDGVGLYGLGRASRVFFGKGAPDLTLAEAALLAAVLQAPNGLSPLRNPEPARERRDLALDRMEELGWATAGEAAAARAAGLGVTVHAPEPYGATHLRAHVTALAEQVAPEKLDRGLGFAADTTVDPLLQHLAEQAVAEHLAKLRRDHPRLRDAGLTAALVALDARSGAALAWVGGDPAAADGYDRVTRARRQPGSAIKPLLLLEAFDRCGERSPITPATLVSDDPLTIDTASGPWEPHNYDGLNHGVIDVRTALAKSYNLPFVRISRYCGVEHTAATLREAGITLPDPAPPSFALGAVETTPLEMAGAYMAFADLGRVAEPYAVARLERPGGRKLERDRATHHRVTRQSTAFLVRDLLREAVTDGTGRRADIPGVEVIGKTGTTPADAWFVGHAGSIVTAVWIGLDGGGELGLTGGGAAAPLFSTFMRGAVPKRPPMAVDAPGSVVERRVNPETGRRPATPLADGETEIFRRGAVPRRDPLFRDEDRTPVIR